ncbi:MAG: hypothetical protein JHC33_07330 [Ignisphaera sp.]|nr:hypothetical protein [Ignisphaera sp.]
MQSVIKPLNAKVKVLTANIVTILTGLKRGDPETKKQIKSLCSDVKNAQSEFKSTVNSMYASYESSVSTMAGLYNPMPMIKIIVYFLREALAAVELLNNLLKLAAALLNINTVISLIIADLELARGWINKKLVWLTKALNRIKQKVQKNIEWIKRQVIARATLVYLNYSKKITEAAISFLQSKTKSLEKSPDVNGEYVDGVWVYWSSTEDQKKELLLANTQSQLVQINLEIEKVTFEKDKAIPNDIDWWKTKWKLEEEQDKKDLIADIPKMGVDMPK